MNGERRQVEDDACLVGVESVCKGTRTRGQEETALNSRNIERSRINYFRPGKELSSSFWNLDRPERRVPVSISTPEPPERKRPVRRTQSLCRSAPSYSRFINLHCRPRDPHSERHQQTRGCSRRRWFDSGKFQVRSQITGQ